MLGPLLLPSLTAGPPLVDNAALVQPIVLISRDVLSSSRSGNFVGLLFLVSRRSHPKGDPETTGMVQFFFPVFDNVRKYWWKRKM